jgi:hypothetical protein
MEAELRRDFRLADEFRDEQRTRTVLSVLVTVFRHHELARLAKRILDTLVQRARSVDAGIKDARRRELDLSKEPSSTFGKAQARCRYRTTNKGNAEHAGVGVERVSRHVNGAVTLPIAAATWRDEKRLANWAWRRCW